jgi:hypothetical protein
MPEIYEDVQDLVTLISKTSKCKLYAWGTTRDRDMAVYPLTSGTTQTYN